MPKRHIFFYSSLISLSIISTTAFASSCPWQGPYLGGFIGGGFGNQHLSTDVGAVTNTSYFTDSSNIGSVNTAGTSKNNPQAPIVGVQAGHDWAWKKMVYGVVFDYSTLPLTSSSSMNNIIYPDNSGQYSEYTSITTNWLFTLRGRIGYTTTLWRPSLFYLTGGPALTQIKVNNNFGDTTSSAGAGGTQTFQKQIGWTAGAGFEMAAFNHVHLFLEYLYLETPSVKNVSSITNTQGGFGIDPQSMTSPFTTLGKFHASFIKIGVNYKFDE